MTIYLDEDQVGEDPKQIAYPHLALCMGLTCQMKNGRLIGTHITTGITEAALLAEVKRRIDADPSTIHKVYLTGHIVKHGEGAHGGLLPSEKARAIGYSGDVMVYDTGKLTPTDGSFVRVLSSGGVGDCTLYAVRDEVARPYTVKRGAPNGEVVELQGGAFTSPRWHKTATSAGDLTPLPTNALNIIRVH